MAPVGGAGLGKLQMTARLARFENVFDRVAPALFMGLGLVVAAALAVVG